MQKLVLPADIFKSLNVVLDMAKTHWATYYRLEKRLVLAVSAFAKQQCKPVGKYPVDIKFRWVMADRRRDPDNICSAKKPILDGLVRAGIMKGDGWRYIRSFRDVFELDRVKPRIEVVIT